MIKRRNSGNVNRTDDAAYGKMVASKRMVVVENEEIDEGRVSESDLDVDRQEFVDRLAEIADEIDEAMIPQSGRAVRMIRSAIESLESTATGGREEDE